MSPRMPDDYRNFHESRGRMRGQLFLAYLTLLALGTITSGFRRTSEIFLPEPPYCVGVTYVDFELCFFFQLIDDDDDDGKDEEEEAPSIAVLADQKKDCKQAGEFQVCGKEGVHAKKGITYLQNPMSRLLGGHTICVNIWGTDICFENDYNYFDPECVKLPYGKGFICYKGKSNKNGEARFKHGRNAGETCLRHQGYRVCANTGSYQKIDPDKTAEMCQEIDNITGCVKCSNRGETCYSRGLLTVCIKCSSAKSKKEKVRDVIKRMKDNPEGNANLVYCVRMGIFEICRLQSGISSTIN